MTDYQPMDCDLHDYLEIACLRGYRLNVVLVDGAEFVAKAVTTRTATSKEEFLVMERESEQEGKEQFEVRLDRIRRIEPVDSGADFGVIEF